MKFTLSWLKEYLETEATLEEITDKLTALGLEVEGVENPAEDLADFTVAEVICCEQHPDADKLKCLVVNTGSEKLNVVCGAPNAKAGMKGVFAGAGTYIPGADFKLKKTKIRGAESNGMICSERELCLSDEHEGVIELPADAKVGTPAAEALGLNDPVIEIALTPNRGDCAGIYGIARDLAAAGLGTLKTLDTTPVKPAFDNSVSVSIEDEGACPMFMGRYIKGVKNGPSPDWLQARLKAIGLRPISVLVDITNYMNIGLGRPLHVFDADKLNGDIHIRASKEGETLDALDDKSYALEDGMIAVCDDSGVLGLGGIIGGVPSAVSEETVNVYLEVAYFDLVRTAKTGRALQIDSDARYRFERGIDPAFVVPGGEIATKMVLDLCGGEASSWSVAGAAPDITHTITYAPALVKTLGGSDLDPERQQEILESLGFTVDIKADHWEVATPSWRHDVEGAPDLVEEVLRVDGYDNIPVDYVTPVPGMGRPEPAPLLKNISAVRTTLAMRGLYEAVTWSFMESEKSDLFGANDCQNKKALTLLHPISEEMAVMRPSVLPNLIDAAARNADQGISDAALFEIGNIYQSTEAEGQIPVATGLRTSQAQPRHWSAAARDVDVMDAKADAFAVLQACGFNPDSVQVTTDAPDWYHPGRSGVLRLGRNILAYFGEIHPGVLAEMKRSESYAGFEVFLGRIPVSKKKKTQKALFKPSPFQAVRRDFAFVVDEDMQASTLTHAVSGADKKLITDVTIFDVYTGTGVDEGKKSLALEVTLQPQDKTLTDEEINAVTQKIIEAAEKCGGVLRG